jgi:methylenetetrahydrofolate--tRNA-(uracil-5-)-methyltransferase
MSRLLNNEPLLELPTETMLGALTHYITEPQQKYFQPINSNWAIVKEMDIPKKIRKNKKEKNKILSDRAIEVLRAMEF